MKARQLIREVPDFPKPGIMFRDIAPVLLDPEALHECIQEYSAEALKQRAELIVGIESRGFLFGIPVASDLKLGFSPVRKLGKLPGETVRVEYDLEYGTSVMEMQVDAIQPGQRCFVVDDLLATGGTAAAACHLIERLGGVVAGLAFLIELTFLGGQERLKEYPIKSFIHY